MDPSVVLDYKQAKEDWVSNCTGGSILEVLLIASSCVVSHGLWLALVNAGMMDISLLNGYVVPFLVYVVPALLIQTIAADQSIQVLLGVLFLALNVIYRTPTMQRLHALQRQASGSSSSSTSSPPLPPTTTTTTGYKSYLTVYRAATMILTCIAILAVDFPVFPRRFAKVETFGTSLMDVGVGSFVFSSGIVASRAYTKTITTSSSSSSWLTPMRHAMRSSLPLLVLGGARLVLTQGVDYQLHSSEYGLHWNFFITLGLLAPLVTLVPKRLAFGYLGWMVLVAYQILLRWYGLQHWVLEAPRTNLLSANKEGITSMMGYLAIFLLGLDHGMLLFTYKDTSSDKTQKKKNENGNDDDDDQKQVSLVMKLAVRCVLYWLALAVFFVVMEQGQVVSRRLANLPYAVWVVAFNLTLLTVLMWLEQQIPSKPSAPAFLEAINANGLVTFLVANVMTGVVNLSMQTLYTSTTTSILVLVVYMVGITVFPWILAAYHLRIKL